MPNISNSLITLSNMHSQHYYLTAAYIIYIDNKWRLFSIDDRIIYQHIRSTTTTNIASQQEIACFLMLKDSRCFCFFVRFFRGIKYVFHFLSSFWCFWMYCTVLLFPAEVDFAAFQYILISPVVHHNLEACCRH